MKIYSNFPQFPVINDNYATQKQEMQMEETAKKATEENKPDFDDYDLDLTVQEGKSTFRGIDSGDTCQGTYGASCGGTCACSDTCTCQGTYGCS